MIYRSVLLLLVSVTLTRPAAGQTQEGPRQLNTLPSLGQDTTHQKTRHQLNPRVTAADGMPQQDITALPGITEIVNQRLRRIAQLPDTARLSYAVGLKTGQVYTAYQVDTEQSFLGGSAIVLDRKQSFDLNAVRYYEYGGGFYVRAIVSDRPKHEKTFRLNNLGRLKLYSVAEPQYTAFDKFSVYYRVSNVLYFTKDDGPVKKINLKNLLLATTEHQPSTNLLLQTRRQRAYSTISYIAGGSLLLAGLIATVNPNSDSRPALSPMVYGSLPFIMVPLLIGSKKEENIQRAIADYNKTFRTAPIAR